MSRLFWSLITIGGITLAAAHPCHATREAEWRADIRFLLGEIARIHPDPYRTHSEEEFEAQAAALEERVGELSDAAVLVEVQRIVAMLEDGHSSVWFPTAGPPFDVQLPVLLYPFEEGLYVSSANRAYANIVGGRVTRVGRVDADEAIRRVREVISGENAFTVLDRVPQAFTRPALLHALGISEGPDRVRIEVGFDDGTRAEAHVSAVPADAFTFTGPEVLSGDAVSARGESPVPLSLRRLDETYWFEHDPERRILYVQFNGVRNDASTSLRAFFDDVFAFADGHDVDRFVLDIRYNHGGNNQLLRPLIHGLIKRDDTINRPGHFFTIIGRGTFSAAVSCTAWLEEHTNVRFVGEPAGSSPNHFGDAEHVVLPNAGVTVSISEWLWQTRLPWDDREWFAPSLIAPTTFADYRAGRDGPMAAIRRAGDAPPLADALRRALEGGGADAARDVYAQFKAENPDRWGVTTEAEVNRAGYLLLGDGRVEEAIVLFRLNTDSYPQSANAWDSLAEGVLRSGDEERAIELYRKAIAVDPGFQNAHRMLAELTGGSTPHH